MCFEPENTRMAVAEEEAKFLVDALYCSEEELQDECGSDSLSSSSSIINPPPLLLEQDMVWDEQELTWLLAKEHHNPLCTCLQTNPLLDAARTQAVDWILTVTAHYSFSPLTALLAVNYLDRFLFSFRFESGKPWMTQLAAVACLSLAAKVQETQVPLLLDLQVEDCTYVFEAKTIKRMEILVLSTLGWKMNPVTPLSFLDYITRRLGLKDYHLCWEFLSRCESLLLSLLRDSRFVGCLPSVLATATMMHVVNGVEPCLRVEYQKQLLGILGINKEEVEECCKLMLQGQGQGHKRKCFGSNSIPIPSSPNGVMDVSFSCDSSNDSWAVAASSPEPLSKKTRTTQHHLLLHHSHSDFLAS